MIKNLSVKMGLVILGVFLSLFMVEIGFRVAGGLLSAGREIRNRQGLLKDGTYRILCLGESTTQGQWPPFLEEALNKRGKGLAFKVIDKGKVGAYSGVILSELEHNIEAFNPHMIVVMMGINDGEWVWRNPTEYEDSLPAKTLLFFKNTRLNKLARYLVDALKNRRPPLETAGPLSESAYEEAEKMHLAEIASAPGSSRGYIELGKLYRENGAYDKAKKAFDAGIAVDANDPAIYLEFGNMYYKMEDFDRAGEMYAAGIRADPKYPLPYGAMGNVYRMRRDWKRAKEAYESGIKVDPKSSWLYYELGTLYREMGHSDEAARMYETAIKINPKDAWNYIELENLYLKAGEIEKLAALLAKGSEETNGDPRLMGALSLLHLQQGKQGLPVKRGMTPFPPPATVQNYQKLRDVVLKSGKKLVCMQYPMRDVAVLESILGPDKRILFVENKSNFEETLRTRKLAEIFNDTFAGDFGHCTDLGNRMIASNLAAAIGREVMGSAWEK